MSDETQDKVTVTLSETGLEYLDLFLTEDEEENRELGDKLPEHMRGRMSREVGVFFCIMYTFLTLQRGVHPRIAGNLVRSMVGQGLDKIDETMREIQAAANESPELSQQLRDAIRMRVFVVSHAPRKGDEPIH